MSQYPDFYSSRLVIGYRYPGDYEICMNVNASHGGTDYNLLFRQLSDNVIFGRSGATFNDVLEHCKVLQDASPARDDRMVSPQNEIYEVEITFSTFSLILQK
jgi:hypothetical protein